MRVSRRHLLRTAAVLPLAASGLARMALAQGKDPLPGAPPVPPILFVHGNGDHAALWITTFWRMESNGIARDRLAAVNFLNPLARGDDARPQPMRSSTEDQRLELARAVAAFRQRTGAPRIALVGSSRGGNAIRSFIRNGGGGEVSHAVLCGTPNHGVFAWDENLGSEFNGRGPFLTGLNQGRTEVTPGTAFLTLRSDRMDKYAQPDGRFIGKPGRATNVGYDGPELKGATNLVLGDVDHRETAFSARAFKEIYRFIAGSEPARIAIVPEAEVRLSGLVTDTPGGVPTNRPVADASVEVYRVAPDTGERIGDAVHVTRTAADGRWGPAQVKPDWYLEFVLGMRGSPTTHIYRSPFARSSDIVHLRAAHPLSAAESAGGAIVIMSRPRGYFGLPRDIVLLDGKTPSDVKGGVPADSTAIVRLPKSQLGRPVVAMFNEERIVARAWPASQNRVAVAELTY
ncbi:MAG: hydrolase [Xanthobacteraceae bacterium]|nr:hydrolase [Xanthobacteraceae bacterium]